MDGVAKWWRGQFRQCGSGYAISDERDIDDPRLVEKILRHLASQACGEQVASVEADPLLAAFNSTQIVRVHISFLR
jgi:hypothetical protein